MTETELEELTEVAMRCFTSEAVHNDNLHNENIVDVVSDLASKAAKIAQAITPRDAVAGQDAAGGHVSSLTEAVMGVTAGLCQIAGAIERLADAVDLRK